MINISKQSEEKLTKISQIQKKPIGTIVENMIREYSEDFFLAMHIEEGRKSKPLGKDEALKLLNESNI